MKNQAKLACFFLVMLLASPSFAVERNPAPSIQGPPLFQSLYLKVFRPTYESWTSPYAVPSYHCNERTDLQEVVAGGDLLNPGDQGYIRQYDPILSTSILCEGIDNNGQYVQRSDYETIVPDSDIWNTNGLPMQVFGVKAYCEGNYSEPFFIAAKQVILLCVDHSQIPDE